MAESPTKRPNRWTGPPSTWRSYTREERGVVKSLDTIRSQDLSIHLYNAHAIKSRVRTAKEKGETKSTGGKESDFIPPDVWTAWPMPAEEVPRDSYLPNVGGLGAWRMEEIVRPSADLEAALLATTTRIARERWRARKWEWSGSKAEEAFKKGTIVDETGLERSPVETEETETQIFSSQAFDVLGEADSSPDDDDKARSDEESKLKCRPVPLADDDRSLQLLLPSIRHVIAQVDDLLLGLKKAREAYAGNWNKSMGDVTSSEETDTGAETSRGRGRSSRQRKRARTSSVESEASLMSATSNPSKIRPRSKRALKLRDWSDVLGMAALTGWNPAVVQRAAERCSSLFGEDMLIRTFSEGAGGEKSFFTELFASGAEPGDSSAEDMDHESELAPDPKENLRIRGKKREEPEFDGAEIRDSAIRCPVTTCPGHEMVYTRAKNMYDHVRKFHPEIDIKELKRLEAKRHGDRRGKWDRSRNRSSSQVPDLSQ